MESAPSLRFVRFDDPHAFLEATKDADDSFMNFGVGSLRDFLNGISTREISDIPTRIFAVYRGEELLATISKNRLDFARMVSTPSASDELLAKDPSLVVATAALLATSVFAELPDPTVVDKVIGPLEITNAFLEAWVVLVRAQLPEGASATILGKDDLGNRVSYATKASLPPLPATPSSYIVERTQDADRDAVATLYQQFQAAAPWQAIISHEEALQWLVGPHAARLVWICRVEPGGAPVAYAALGRGTPRTIAIRNVYVAPAHRRKGIAETMVRAITRFYLGVRPYGAQGVPEGPPELGVKEEVNLNVADLSAEGVYRRCGFLFPDRTGEDIKGGVDPVTGRRAWYLSAWRGVQIDTPVAEAAEGKA